MKKNTLAAGVLAALSFIAPFNQSFAKTLYVETWGADNATCSKSAPCHTLGGAIGIAGNRDRIVVGPGTFDIPNPSLEILQTSLKLTSVAGARATTLVPSGNGEAIEIEATGVTIGQRGKGFTFRGNFDGYPAVYVDTGADKARIEGNIFIDENDNASSAIDSDSARNTVRGNVVQGFSDAIYLDNSSLDGTRHQVRDNHVTGARNICIGVGSGEKSRNLVSGNVVTNCDYVGFEIYGGDSSGDRIEKNVVEQRIPPAYPGAGIYVFGGSPQVRRNAIRGQLVSGIYVEGDITATIRDNLVADTETGILVENNTIRTVIQGNTLVGNDTSVVFPRTEDSIRTFRSNNLLDYDCPYDFIGDQGFIGPFSPPFIVSDKTYHDQALIFGNLVIDCAFDNTAESAIAEGFLEISRPASKANAVKYKSDL